MNKWICTAAVCLATFAARARSAEAELQKDDLLAVCGDSITEQKLYSVDMEDYLLMCKPAPGAHAVQFGWGGETSWGFHDKMPVYMLPFHATAATTCYGMNDGAYSAMNDEKAAHYRQAQTAILEDFKKSGVHFIVLGSPGAVDSTTFHRGAVNAEVYNKTLAALGEIDREIAKQQGVTFADVHGAMMDAMTKAKAKYGAGYEVAGKDGIHPGANGHLVMAYAFLKALGVSGDIGTITVDLAGNKADASEGHKVVSCKDGTIEIESTRYPFCFYGDPKSSDATTGMIEFIPFNQDLNRFKLIVNNPGADHLKVTWGDTSKEFPAADLAKGINLAAEFLNNPFSKPFAAVHEKVRHKQDSETILVKNMQEFYRSVPQREAEVPAEKESLEKMVDSIRGYIASQSKAIGSVVEPVNHSIKIEQILK